MATATTTRHTPEDLLKITDRPMPELIDGQFVERQPMGQKSDAVANKISRVVGNFVDQHRLGLVNGSQGSFQIFPDDPDKVRIPDVSFTSSRRLPEGLGEDGHAKIAPDLVVQVLSPNDRAVEVAAKVEDFLAAGVRMIWVVNPYSRHVQIHRGDRSISVLKTGDPLDGGDVLPGFECPVAALFER